LLDITELLDLFGLFLLVLIGVELLDTLKAYIKDNVVHVEVVLTVAMIAIARKVIILDVKELPSMTLFGIGTGLRYPGDTALSRRGEAERNVRFCPGPGEMMARGTKPSSTNL
jgi:hypothetical protein